MYVPQKNKFYGDLKLLKVFFIRLFIFNSLLKIHYVYSSELIIDCRIANQMTTTSSNQFPHYSDQITQDSDIILFIIFCRKYQK